MTSAPDPEKAGREGRIGGGADVSPASSGAEGGRAEPLPARPNEPKEAQEDLAPPEPQPPAMELRGALWQGPFPPPAAMEHYERILPGFFERTLSMAERAQSAEIEQARLALEYARKDMRRGQLLGFVIAIGAILAALAALWMGNPWVATVFVSVPVMGVARALIPGPGGRETGE